MQITDTRTATLKIILLGLLFAITGLIYYQGLSGPFLLDDLQNLSYAKITDYSWQEWLKVSLSNTAGPFRRPLSIASFVLNEYWFGFVPFGYKIVNLSLHFFISLLIYPLIYRILRILETPAKTSTAIAFITVTLWLLHPLQVSTVLYAVQRMTQLSALFLVLGMLFYVQGRPKLSFLCWPLAIFSKETGVLLPFYLLAIEYFIFRFKTQNPKKLHYLLFWNAITVIVALGYYLSHYENYRLIFESKGYTLVQQLLTQIQILCFYLQLIVLPKLNQLSLFHDDFPIVTKISAPLLSALLAFAGLMIVIFISKKKHPILAFGIALFFISHLIESTVLPLELVFEHRNYLAILGPLFIFSYYTIASISRFKTYIIVLPSILTVCFLTFIRIQAWSDPELFLNLAIIEHPNSPRAHIEWANFLLEQNDIAQAHQHLSLAHQLAPRDAGIRLHQLLIQCENPLFAKNSTQQDLEYQAVVNDMQNLTLTPYSILVFNNLVDNSYNNRCSSLSSEKILHLLNLAILNPHVQFQKNYLATLYHLRAGIKVKHHDFENAIIDLDKAYEAYPKRLEPLIEKVHLQIKLNQPIAAAQSLDRVNQLAQTQWVNERWMLDKLQTDIK